MKSDVAIKISHISKSFRVPHEKHNSLKDKAVHIFGPKKFTKYKALENIDFEIKKGEFFGIVGKNGSGKSTLLKMLANIYQPSSGKINVNGTLAPFIELGVGFNPELTGRENIFLSGAILGMNRKKIEKIYDDIVAFAELEEFMDQKLKNYSSGMQVRLAFSIAVRAESDILLIDEVLAVGDAAFQSKCLDYFQKLKLDKKTVVFVSHDMDAVERLCDKAAFINDSHLIAIGSVEKVIDAYSDINMKKMITEQNKKMANKDKSIKTNLAEIYNIEVLRNGKSTKLLKPSEEFSVIFDVKAFEKIEQPILGITIKQKESDVVVFADNTKISKIETQNLNKGQRLSFKLTIKNVFSNGTYLITPAIADRRSLSAIDRKENGAFFIVDGWENAFVPVQIDREIGIKYDK